LSTPANWIKSKEGSSNNTYNQAIDTEQLLLIDLLFICSVRENSAGWESPEVAAVKSGAVPASVTSSTVA